MDNYLPLRKAFAAEENVSSTGHRADIPYAHLAGIPFFPPQPPLRLPSPSIGPDLDESLTSLETARSLSIGPSWGGGVVLREKYVFCVPWELQRLISHFCLSEESVGGAQRRGKFSSLKGKHALH